MALSNREEKTQRIEQLEKELSNVKAIYKSLVEAHMENGVIVFHDEAAEKHAKELKKQLEHIHTELNELKFNLLSDEEKNERRQNSMALADKFSDDAPNPQRLEYMKAYMKFLEQVKQRADTAKDPVYGELYDYLNGAEFRYELPEKLDAFCEQDPLLEELYLQMKRTFSVKN